jgi:metal-responsive CopG/Arc/MetJ family transcriptional regulator
MTMIEELREELAALLERGYSERSAYVRQLREDIARLERGEPLEFDNDVPF